MQRIHLLIGLLLLALLVGGCDTALRGSGNVKTESRNVSGFQQVELDGQGTLTITQGDNEALTVEAEDNILPRIKTTVANNRLTISFDRQGLTAIEPTRPINYALTLKDLSALDLSGSG